MLTRKRRRQADKAAPDLTPMIDVTFLLIIFFIVVTRITSQDHVDLRLPDAITAIENPDRAANLFTIHLAPLDQRELQAIPERFGWFCYGDPHPRNSDEMAAILRSEAALVDYSRDLPGRNAEGISENTILLRCDARCPAGEFGRLIELMSEARLYKVKIAISRDQSVE